MLMDWQKFIQAVFQTEETFIPLFIHNSASGKIAGVILASEAAVAGILTQFGVVPPAPPTPPVQQ